MRGFDRPPIGPLVRRFVMLELKTRKTHMYDTAVVIVCKCGCVSARQEWLGVGLGMRLGEWGLDAPAHPSSTIL